VVLTSLQGLSYKEAAVVLETTEGTIAWRIHEARRKMRGYLVGLETGRARARRRPMSDSAVFRLEKALVRLVPAVPTPAAAG
jgi:RNA polymerase sigma-70 factor (ECF subfamily)